MTVELIGGEMLVWSDLDGTHGPAPAGGAALRSLLSGVTGRTLVAGPHDPDLLDALPAAPVTLLVRGVADAEALAERYASRAGWAICCGSLDKLATVPAYDTVVALDGLGRLGSAEAADCTGDETLSRLVAVLRPGGRLLLTVPNPFGLDRLVSLPAAPADADWAEGDEPHTPGRLRARLAAAGLPVVRDYAVYPGVGEPAVLLSDAVLGDVGLRGFLEATVGAAFSAGPAVLTDPVRLAVGALRHDLAAQLAPGWIFLAGGGPPGPAALIAPGPSVVRRDAAGRWVLGGGTPVPLGRTLADLLLAACRRRALPAVRELLTTWQASPVAGVPADRIVVDADGHLHGLAPAGEPLRALRRFAAAVIAAGDVHLWPSPADEAELTALLAGMTGREVEPHRVPGGEPAPAGVRELAMARDRLARELAEARSQHEFHRRTIAARDAELRRTRQLNAILAATAPGRAVTGLLRALRRAWRK
ncbi:hypothetical protein [Paractinoplanes rishiriensis]|uniref:Methyltransferase n=1 Tax=Paractinoplanes rishiriensis TaxID=1050105 RepID=A0A919MUU0_9ACTN|nr:hypothetical protein [Actinoplanes rishiriensis]GIF00687.1 hypothetical protein Ari01nite_81510 [Actinoplanes rishiriensis]